MSVFVSVFEEVKQKYVIYFFVYIGETWQQLLQYLFFFIINTSRTKWITVHTTYISEVYFKNWRLSKKYPIDSHHHPFIQIKQLHHTSTAEHTLFYPKFLCTPPKTWIDFLEKLFFCLPKSKIPWKGYLKRTKNDCSNKQGKMQYLMKARKAKWSTVNIGRIQK